jgi:ADP-ribosylglycohydrolase
MLGPTLPNQQSIKEKAVKEILIKLGRVWQAITNATHSGSPKPDIIVGTYHFDWFFPNLSINGCGVDYGEYENKLSYDEDLVNSLIENQEYRKLYLEFTKEYFAQAGLIDLARIDLAPDDLSTIRYHDLQGYLIRLDKIIQSYRLLLYYTQKQYNQTKNPQIKEFLDDLTKTYKAVYKSIISNYEQFTYQKPGIDSSKKQTIAQCFENNIDKMVFNPDPRKSQENQELINDVKLRSFANVVFSYTPIGGDALVENKSVHLLIEEEVELQNRTKGAIYCQAIFDAIGLTTEFMGKQQAKLILHNAGVVKIGGDYWDVEIQKDNLHKFQENPYQIRKDIHSQADGLLLTNQAIFPNLYSTDPTIYPHENKKGISSLRLDNWRQIVPKGSATDDTDQAFLKFKALKEAGGNISEAQKIYARDILAWKDWGGLDYFGKSPFGLGGNTSEVIRSAGFLDNPEAQSKRVWIDTAINGEVFRNQDGNEIGKGGKFFTQANGALMSSSYILQYYPDSLDLAQEATHQLAKVTHYDPVVCAHCVAYVTMLYYLQHHKGEISSEVLLGYQEESYRAGVVILEKRKEEYQEIFNRDQSLFSGGFNAQIDSWKTQMKKAIMGYNHDASNSGFKSWDDLHLVNPDEKKGGDGKLLLPAGEVYDNIGMSHRALSAGFFALTKMHHYINNPSVSEKLSKKDALTKVCIELIAQGGDADTNGTVVGSLCGSYVGFHEIPKKMVSEFGKGDRGDEKNVVTIPYRDGSVRYSEKNIKETKLLEEIISISSQKIAKQRTFEERKIFDSSGNASIAIGTIVKPYYNETLLNKKYKTDLRDIDFTVFDDYKIKDHQQSSEQLAQLQKIDLSKVNNAIKDNLIIAQSEANLNDFEVAIAIKYAKKFGGFSNILDANGVEAGDDLIINQMRKDIYFTGIPDNNSDEYDKSANNLLEKFKNFSAFVQEYNQECGIYSGRKNGKLVGLRLAFVSDEVNLLFSSKIKEIDKKKILTSQAILSARRNKESLKKNHTKFLNDNLGLKNKIESTKIGLGIGVR